TSPPYDVIAHDAEDHLLASDPHNIVRLILPRRIADNPGAGGNGATGPGAVLATGADYADAARLMRDWQDDGILVPDPLPALYVYEASLPAGQVLQRGLIGALRLAPLDAGPVLPHEDVIPGPVAGRRQLMEATGANLEPIFLLYDGHGPGAVTAQIIDRAIGREPLVTIDTDDGIWHRLWGVTDPAEQAEIAADLGSPQALIADGHHRYAAYPQLQARKRRAGAGPGPWDAGLALLVDSTEFPPRIGAIHRLVPGLRPAAAARIAERAFTVRALPGVTQPAALAALHDVSERHTAFLVAGGREFYLLTDPDPEAVQDAMPRRSDPGRGAALLRARSGRRCWGEGWGIPPTPPSTERPPTAGARRGARRPAPPTPPRSSARRSQRTLSAMSRRTARRSRASPPRLRPSRAAAWYCARSLWAERNTGPGRGSAPVRRPDEEPVGALGQRHEVAGGVGRQLHGPRDPAALL